MSQSKMRLVSTVGMGVLVGTSLIVIIPEGVETLYSAASIGKAHKTRAINSKDLDVRWPVFEGYYAAQENRIRLLSRGKDEDTRDLDAFNELPGPVLPEGMPVLPNSNGDTTPVHPFHDLNVDTEPAKPTISDSDRSEEHAAHSSPHAWVGLSLVLGFILMYLIDQIPLHASAHAQTNQQPYHISLENLSQGLHRPSSPSGDDDSDGFHESRNQSRPFATTIGLVIHAAADGIALGASSSGSDTSLGFIIFFAIMVHKAPAAFGLTSVLLKQGLTKREARAHLIIFSLAAPAGAIATWSIVNLLGRGRIGGEEGTKWWTGVLLLFSAGTFLYVAMHTMQEDSSTNEEQYTNGYADGHVRGASRKETPTMRRTLAAVVGMLLPLVTQVGHAH
ncbi:MAG: hypothetical protein M1827_002632 [Pycnora praestabilis]|nr:MAG: hypothetical protein M1827_002632 [Pycnora praestabilis]